MPKELALNVRYLYLLDPKTNVFSKITTNRKSGEREIYVNGPQRGLRDKYLLLASPELPIISGAAEICSISIIAGGILID